MSSPNLQSAPLTHDVSFVWFLLKQRCKNELAPQTEPVCCAISRPDTVTLRSLCRLPVYLGIMWYCRVGVVPDIIINVAPRWSLQLTNHVRCFFLEVEHQHGDISWSNGDVNFRKSCPARLYRCLPLFLVFMRTRLAAATDTRLVFIFIYLIIQWKVNKPTPMCIWGSCMRTL